MRTAPTSSRLGPSNLLRQLPSRHLQFLPPHPHYSHLQRLVHVLCGAVCFALVPLRNPLPLGSRIVRFQYKWMIERDHERTVRRLGGILMNLMRHPRIVCLSRWFARNISVQPECNVCTLKFKGETRLDTRLGDRTSLDFLPVKKLVKILPKSFNFSRIHDPSNNLQTAHMLELPPSTGAAIYPISISSGFPVNRFAL